MADERNNEIEETKIQGVNGPITGWLDGYTILVGLMSYPIRHTMSPTMHNNAFAKLGLNGAYLCFEIDNEKLPGAIDAIRTLDMRGSNVSMPNKKKVIPYLDKLDKTSQMCDAVNTIVNEHGVLTDTIKKYNSYVDAGHDPEFGKSAFHLKCEVAPFYATPRKPAIHHTMGGLVIDTKGHVLDKAGHVIAGLYSAGENAGGLHAGNRLGGNSLADIFTFGRIAADTADEENPASDAVSGASHH